jgi:hypothetical protein
MSAHSHDRAIMNSNATEAFVTEVTATPFKWLDVDGPPASGLFCTVQVRPSQRSIRVWTGSGFETDRPGSCSGPSIRTESAVRAAN